LKPSKVIHIKALSNPTLFLVSRHTVSCEFFGRAMQFGWLFIGKFLGSFPDRLEKALKNQHNFPTKQYQFPLKTSTFPW
jgi:hypothetical protein